MAAQTIAASEVADDLPHNEFERLMQTTLGKDWLTDGMGRLSPDELKSAQTLCGSHIDCITTQIETLGRVLGNRDPAFIDDHDVHAIGWAISDLAARLQFCDDMRSMAKELETPEGRDFQLKGLIRTSQGTVRVDRSAL